jgi:O-acetyl-ADP-ribose deacetylase (regulator of RNase III)
MISYEQGDAVYPQPNENFVIAHVCNDIGRWGAGFVLALDKRSLEMRHSYLSQVQAGQANLGDVHYVVLPDALNGYVANMVAQRGTRSLGNPRPLSYPWLRMCLQDVSRFALRNQARIVMPRIGCGLAGGSWDKVEGLIRLSIDDSIPVVVYDLPQPKEDAVST